VSEYKRVDGTIARVWDNATTQGRPYKVVELENGDRYSLWRKGDFEKVSKGDKINFDFSTTGKFKNIERIYDGSEALQETPGNGSGAKTTMNGKYNGAEMGNGNGNGNGYGAEKLEKMVRMSGLKSAAQIVAACGTKMPFETKLDKTLEAARKFSDYILADDDFGLEPPEPPEPAE